MSEEKLQREARRWYTQALDDLEAARALMSADKYAQTCFYAQQSAEKGLKAVWFLLDLDPWGHSCARLIRNLPEEPKAEFDSLLELALGLDKLYLPTRYPDALPDLIPAEAFTKGEAGTAVQSAEAILIKVSSQLPSN
ncbi:MAG: HEPN domain-containing protein [Cyanobacteria bacterium J06635_1]